MTVLEANVMDMAAMKPPRGAVPVAIEKARRSAIENTITYTGTVRAFEDEDVYPRITGRIVRMPVYPGDRVKRGQLLVELDTDDSEYVAKLDAAKYLGESKVHEAGMARKDFEQAKFTLKAAEEAEQAAARAVDDARAKSEYWEKEIKRQEALLKEDVVSQEEYDSELARFKSAKALLAKAKSELDSSRNSKLAAKAAFEKAVHHVGHEFSASEEAKALEKTARIVERYRELRAAGNGVVIKRLISPGVVVEPGMLILKVAHIDRVRVQAEVSNTDIDRIKLGDRVYIRDSKEGEKRNDHITARVTSIFPAADPSSRTSVVEALIDNLVGRDGDRQVESADQYRFLPGQYVVMDIITGKSAATLTVPSSAIFHREGKPHLWIAAGGASDKKPTFTCTMHPEVHSDKPGNCPRCSMPLTQEELGGQKVARLTAIKVGLANPERTEVLSGLSVGDEVIYRGYADLQPSMPVVAVKWNGQGIERLPFAGEVTSNRLDKGNSWRLEKMVETIMIKASIDPVPPVSKKNTLVLKLTKHGGSTIDNAKISGTSSMPGMDMKGPSLKAGGAAGGVYRIPLDLHSGLWKLDLEVGGISDQPLGLSLDVEVP